jgi:hypothetical protein
MLQIKYIISLFNNKSNILQTQKQSCLECLNPKGNRSRRRISGFTREMNGITTVYC